MLDIANVNIMLLLSQIIFFYDIPVSFWNVTISELFFFFPDSVIIISPLKNTKQTLIFG